jgi:hypothetical protein
MYLVEKPDISIIVQDENGIDLENSLVVRIDNNQLPSEDINRPEYIENPNTISLLTSPLFEQGRHTIEVEVGDVNGNITSTTVEFLVSTEFDLKVYGNFPNPFAKETRIAYTTTIDLDELSVKIYTTSGRLIRTRMLNIDSNDDILSIGYHEIIWDGTDDDGNQVANGIYYCIFSGKNGSESVSHTIKMARLQ